VIRRTILESERRIATFGHEQLAGRIDLGERQIREIEALLLVKDRPHFSPRLTISFNPHQPG
jgi:hypothetical protein